MTEATLLGILELAILCFFLAVTFKPSFAEAVGNVLIAHGAAWRAARREYAVTFTAMQHPGRAPVLDIQRGVMFDYADIKRRDDPESTTEGGSASA